MNAVESLAKILAVEPSLLVELDKVMIQRTKRVRVIDKLMKKNEGLMKFVLGELHQKSFDSEGVTGALRQVIFEQEKRFFDFLQIIEGRDQFAKAAKLAKKIANVGNGFFLKREFAKQILQSRPPRNLLSYLKCKDVDELLKNHDVAEAFSALRFVESDEWMHETFAEIYSKFTSADFEEREIEVRVLGPEWKEVAQKFVAKKHHNVSHLKEFGVIFINPISEEIPGKFLRDFALLLHYFHEIEFYSKLFRYYSSRSDFAQRLNSLLRGDVLANLPICFD